MIHQVDMGDVEIVGGTHYVIFTLDHSGGCVSGLSFGWTDINNNILDNDDEYYYGEGDCIMDEWFEQTKELRKYLGKCWKEVDRLSDKREERVWETPELKYAPRIGNLFGKFDIRNIRLDKYHLLPERQVFFIGPSERSIFTDIILSSFRMISPMVLEIIRMYKEVCFSREVILVIRQQRRSQLYFPRYDVWKPAVLKLLATVQA